MSFQRDRDQVAGGSFAGAGTCFRRAEVLTILYETRREDIQAVLPPPLTPYEKPYVMLSYNNFASASTDRGLTQPGALDVGLTIPAYREGVLGGYIVSMMSNTDMSLFLGREKRGYPKKFASIAHNYENGRYVAYAARHGIPFVIMDAKLDGQPNDPDFRKEMAPLLAEDPGRPGYSVNWTFRWEPGDDGALFRSQPLLIQNWKTKQDIGVPSCMGSAQVELIWSDDDPWAQLEVVRVLGAVLSTVDSQLACEYGRFPVDAKAYEPFAFYGWDKRTMEDFEQGRDGRG